MNEVERTYQELESLKLHLSDSKAELSILSIVSSVDSKVMLLCSASFFERKLCDGIAQISSTGSSKTVIRNFIINQAIKRKYHSFFDWNKNNANKFFALFGGEFKAHMNKIIDDDLKIAVKDFLDLGRTRNELVHQNYATFNMDYTAEDIFNKFKNANLFIDTVLLELSKFQDTNTEIQSSAEDS